MKKYCEEAIRWFSYTVSRILCFGFCLTLLCSHSLCCLFCVPGSAFDLLRPLRRQLEPRRRGFCECALRPIPADRLAQDTKNDAEAEKDAEHDVRAGVFCDVFAACGGAKAQRLPHRLGRAPITSWTRGRANSSHAGAACCTLARGCLGARGRAGRFASQHSRTPHACRSKATLAHAAASQTHVGGRSRPAATVPPPSPRAQDRVGLRDHRRGPRPEHELR